MKKTKALRVVNELEKGLGEGPLTIGIYCTNCDAQFELNQEACAWATILDVPFLEYLRFVQSSPCPKCKENPKK